jgi:CheY-like chemotaxis protein
MVCSQIVTFFLNSPESRAWLVVNGDEQPCHVVEMWKGYPNHWSASMWLAPGEYRCRYYCGGDNHVFYHGPAQVDGKKSEQMDGVVSVENPKRERIPGPVSVLIVEDNLITLEACAKLLRAAGFIVHVADGYQTALSIARTAAVDVALCDIHLWDGDGCDLLNELQSLQPVKAIAMTGYTLPEETDHYRDAGFSTVLRKPVVHSDITSAISQLHSIAAENLSQLPPVQIPTTPGRW